MHPSKRKGNRFERELVDLINAHPNALVEAERARGSDGQAIGECAECDVRIEGPFGVVYRIQAKRRKTVPKWLQIPEGTEMVVFRADRGEPMVVLPLSRLLNLI